MLGQMQDWPLRVGSILDHAAKYHPNRPVVSRALAGPGHPLDRTSWAELRARALRLTQALRRLGVHPGDVVGCMAWNTARHVEAWYAVPGAGAVLHSLNPRLGPEELGYIASHAGDSWLICDPDLAPIIARLTERADRLARR